MECLHCGQRRQEFLCADCAGRKINKKREELKKQKDVVQELELKTNSILKPLAEIESMRLERHKMRVVQRWFEYNTQQNLKRISQLLSRMQIVS